MLAGASLAAAAADGPRWYLQVDNDVPFHTDRWYSSGVRIARVQSRGDHELEWGIVQEIYTPEAKRFAPGAIDRAPAASLMLSLARHDALPYCLQTLALEAGVRGPAAHGRQTTELVHRLVPAPEVDWSREEDNRFAIQAAATRSHRVGAFAFHYGAVAGTERAFAHLAAEWRVGVELPTALLRFAPTPPPAAGSAAWGAFVGLGARAVARDDLLTRGYDAALPALERERIVGRLAAGFGTVQPWGSAQFTLAFDTREFEGQRVPHRFGSLVVHINF